MANFREAEIRLPVSRGIVTAGYRGCQLWQPALQGPLRGAERRGNPVDATRLSRMSHAPGARLPRCARNDKSYFGKALPARAHPLVPLCRLVPLCHRVFRCSAWGSRCHRCRLPISGTRPYQRDRPIALLTAMPEMGARLTCTELHWNPSLATRHCERSAAISLGLGTPIRERDRHVASLLAMTKWVRERGAPVANRRSAGPPRLC